ncbi:hypothetical protein QR680_015097 [Steinernema hermaphroditum]|uniref:7TM GPCR serpentine receptor class x (Srx) domain-containing protein n=1 Tax=Steinernema hermaphroditum TaxID=289476 RepID=A0AA39IDC7_9BILA|nr:hypothetical protein QR680_015097 [Steinernema hermaphroditum]
MVGDCCPFSQPKDINPVVGIMAWTVDFFFAFESCIMVQSVSANRMIAVCFPSSYNCIFTKRVTTNLIIVTWIAAAFVISLYYGIPYFPSSRLALVLFNPEVHEFLGINFWSLKKKTPDVIPTSTSGTAGALTVSSKIDI